MVKELEKEGKNLFECEECRMLYKERELAKKCQDWCSKHHSCNIEIIRHAAR